MTWTFLFVALLLGQSAAPTVTIKLPDLPQAPAPSVRATIEITPGIVYLIEAKIEYLIFTSPEGFLKVTPDPGPFPLRWTAKYIDDPTKDQTRTFTGPYLYRVEPVGIGPVELICVPVGAKTTNEATRRMLLANDGSKPPPPVLVTVPNLVGSSVADASKTLLALGLIPGTMSEDASSSPKGLVIKQAPAAGAQVVAKTSVSLTSSSGEAPVVLSEAAAFVRDNVKSSVLTDPILRKKQCVELAEVCRRIADDIDKPRPGQTALSGGQAIIDRTVTDFSLVVKDNSAVWDAFNNVLADKLLNPYRKAGKLATDAMHAQVWRELAAGFAAVE